MKELPSMDFSSEKAGDSKNLKSHNCWVFFSRTTPTAERGAMTLGGLELKLPL